MVAILDYHTCVLVPPKPALKIDAGLLNLQGRDVVLQLANRSGRNHRVLILLRIALSTPVLDEKLSNLAFKSSDIQPQLVVSVPLE